jgi:hypothetical protein
MSKYIYAGEPVAKFIKRADTDFIGCWVVRSLRDSAKLQRHIGASAYRAGYKVHCKTMSCIDEEKNCVPSVKYILMAKLYD